MIESASWCAFVFKAFFSVTAVFQLNPPSPPPYTHIQTRCRLLTVPQAMPRHATLTEHHSNTLKTFTAASCCTEAALLPRLVPWWRFSSHCFPHVNPTARQTWGDYESEKHDNLRKASGKRNGKSTRVINHCKHLPKWRRCTKHNINLRCLHHHHLITF